LLFEHAGEHRAENRVAENLGAGCVRG
jgi:hypothetical protein